MIQVFTDSAANLTLKMQADCGIQVVPMSFTLDEVTHSGNEEFNGHEFYEALRHGAESKSSMPNLTAVREAFETALKKGDDILYVGLSSGISGTYWSGQMTAEELKEQYPDRKICSIDTRAAGLAEGLIVMTAAKLARNGSTFEEIVAALPALCQDMCQYFVVDDLKFLRRGGRISGATALAGTLLQIKPILKGDDEGKIVMHAKARGKLRALEMLTALYREKRVDPARPVAISHGDCPGEALRLEAKLREAGQTGEIIIACHEPVTGSHVGPGTVALFFWGNGVR
jgi:DegV family protein with EDD domain